MLAAKENFNNTFEILIDSGADLSIEDNFGKSIYDYITNGLFNELAACILFDSKKVSTVISLVADSAFDIVEEGLKKSPAYIKYKSFISEKKLNEIILSLSFILSSRQIKNDYGIENAGNIFFNRYGWKKQYKTSCILWKKLEAQVSETTYFGIDDIHKIYNFIYSYLLKDTISYTEAEELVNDIFNKTTETVQSLFKELPKMTLTQELIQK